MSDKITTAFFLIALFVMSLLSWGPLATVISDNAADPALTNAMWLWFDSFFNIFWGMFSIMTLGVALWVLVEDF